jgi:hypothetical protein
MFKILVLICIFISSAFALNTYDRDEIRSDYKKGYIDKYRNDNLPLLDDKALLKMKIFTSLSDMKPPVMSKEVCAQKLTSINALPMEVFKCKTSITNTNLTSALYDINLGNGTYTCAVAEKGNQYNSLGYYKLDIPDGCKEFLKKDKITAKFDNAELIYASESIYSDLYAQKKIIKDSITSYDGNNYLNISDILLSSILTDTDIINLQSTKSTNRVQLQEGYNSQITDTSMMDLSSVDGSPINTTSNNSDFISSKAATISDVYAKLSDLSMVYLYMLVLFFGVWGIGRSVALPFVNKIEKKQDHDKKTPYIAALFIGAALFLPVSREDITTDGITEQYSVMKNNYQQFERLGYYLFMNWANEASGAIVDSEMDSLISRAGLSNTSDIIHNYSSKEQTAKYYNINRNIVEACKDIYDNALVSQLIQDKTNSYPISELSFFAENINNGNGPTYYQHLDNGGVVKNYYYDDDSMIKGDYYPKLLLSTCGKSNSKLPILNAQYNDYDEALTNATTELNNASDGKIKIIKTLMKFQYELNRDFGPLGILGLPVTIMQTEHIGSLIKKDTDIKDNLESSSVLDSTIHSFLSTIPYLLVPGSSTIYNIAKDHGMIIGAASGAALGLAVTEGDESLLNKIYYATLGGAAGAGIGKVFPELIGMMYGYEAALTLIALVPVLGIFLIGLGRFITIIIKIFIFHFASVFILPILFLKNNTEQVSKFSIKILATMLELPLFVLSIWIAMTSYSLLTILGESISKRVILGMLENINVSTASRWEIMKIYFFDGLVEVGIVLFSVVVIYKVIVTMHSSIMELFEIGASSSLDSMADSMQNETHKIRL